MGAVDALGCARALLRVHMGSVKLAGAGHRPALTSLYRAVTRCRHWHGENTVALRSGELRRSQELRHPRRWSPRRRGARIHVAAQVQDRAIVTTGPDLQLRSPDASDIHDPRCPLRLVDDETRERRGRQTARFHAVSYEPGVHVGLRDHGGNVAG